MANKKLIEELIERDTPRAVKEYPHVIDGIDPWAMCPKCGKLLLTDDINFCPHCGQRVLMDTWAL